LPIVKRFALGVLRIYGDRIPGILTRNRILFAFVLMFRMLYDNITYGYIVDGKTKVSSRTRTQSTAVGSQNITGFIARVFCEKTRTLFRKF